MIEFVPVAYNLYESDEITETYDCIGIFENNILRATILVHDYIEFMNIANNKRPKSLRGAKIISTKIAKRINKNYMAQRV